MKKIILLIAIFCVFCVGALRAQSPVRGVTVNGAYDTLRTIETTPRFVGPTGELHRYPALTINGQVLPAPDLTALTFEAMTAGAVVTFTPTSYIPTLSIEYSFNGGAWTNYTAPITLTNVGDKVSFRGNNAAYSVDPDGSDECSNFSCSDSCYMYGNIMSLVDATNYPTNTTLTEEFTFSSLFSQNDYIFNHPTQMLYLPATTLTNYCYSNMFGGCTELTIAPALPATTLDTSCYAEMFNNCLSLTAAPELPATTLQENCYQSMFYNDTSLTTAPVLPATTLAEGCYVAMFADCANMTTAPELPATTLSIGCYMEMFAGCTSLTTAPALPAMTMTVDCYEYMFYGCTSLTTAPELPAMTLDYACYSDMFAGCTSLTTAPVLPATMLADWCYSSMFSGCENLNSVTCLATSFTSSNCTYNWLMNVASTGTFVKEVSMTEWTPDSPSGIPSGWAVTTPPQLFPLTFEAKAAGAEVTFTPATSLSLSIEYSLDGVAWTTYTTPITLANVGDKVYFRGNNATYATELGESNFSFTDKCYVYGNIMSLVDASNYATNTTLTGTYTFSGLFFNNANLYSHPTKTLILPATTLTDYCYYNMFGGCTELTIAPELPATTVQAYCYAAMFSGCTNLTTVPTELPAKTLAEYCYKEMFENCKNMTVAPDLPANTLSVGCYYEMFNGCERLNHVTCYATNISATDCIKDWLTGVASSGHFSRPSSMTGWVIGVNVPSGWTIGNVWTIG